MWQYNSSTGRFRNFKCYGVGLIKCIDKYKNLKLSNIKIIKDAYKIERSMQILWKARSNSQSIWWFNRYKNFKNEKLTIKKIKINSKIKNIINNIFA